MKDERMPSSPADRGIRDAAAQNADELAKSLAMIHATLESTTDAILVTDESNQVRAFNEKYINLWAIPAEIRTSQNANDFWNHASRQLRDPAAYLERIREIIASPVSESFDVLHLADGRVSSVIPQFTWLTSGALAASGAFAILPSANASKTRWRSTRESWRKSLPVRHCEPS
jgi:PAS domain-containing protein